MVKNKLGGKYNLWAKRVLIQSQRTIRCLSRYHNVDRIMRLHKNLIITMNLRRISKNTRNQQTTYRENPELRFLTVSEMH